MKNYRKKILFNTPLILFFLNPLFFIRRSLSDSLLAKKNFVSGRVLDIGCGSKPYENLFDYDEYIGIDVRQSGHNHNESEIDFYYDGRLVPFNNDSFDCVVSFEVIEHVEDLSFFLSEAKRVLKKNAPLIISVPFLWGEHEIPYDFRRFTIFGVKQILEQNGFKTIEIEKSGSGVGIIYQLFVDYLYKILPGKTFSRIIYALFLSWLNLFFYLYSKFTNNSNIYANIVIVARKI